MNTMTVGAVLVAACRAGRWSCWELGRQLLLLLLLLAR